MSDTQTILIIDDSPHVRELLEHHLRELGVRLCFASTGRDGIALATETVPDLILLDLQLPDMTGFDVIRVLKREAKTFHIPVIFVTGSESAEDKVTGFDLGGVDYVTKPFESRVLRARVGSALRTQELLRLLTTQTQIDALTGLSNRRYFDHRLTQEIDAARRYQRSVGLLMIDIDHFKLINDRHGHQIGDRVLKVIGSLLERSCRSSDVACRYGGEEFAIILAEAGIDQAYEVARRILIHVRGDAMLQGMIGRRISVSIGGAAAGHQAWIDGDSLIQEADRALYAAKHAGRDQAHLFDPNGQPRILEPTC